MTDSVALNYGTVEFNGVPFPVDGPVSYRQLAKFESRIVTGDPSKDDDELLSTKVYSDFSGGLGVLNEKEGADVGRFWFGVGLDVSHPGQIALEPRVYNVGGITGANWYPLGQTAGTYYAAQGLLIYYLDTSTQTFVSTTKSLAFVPVSKAISYFNILYIPQGNNGYQTWDGTNVVNGIAGHKVVDFCLWDKRLVALCIGTTTRRLDFYDGATWTTPTGANVASVGTSGGVKVRSFYTRGDEPEIFIITSTTVWGYDPVGEEMLQTNVQFPKSSVNANGVEVWRAGENLNISAGMGLYAWSGPGGSIAPIGLDRDEGLPFEYAGAIADLEPGLNDLYALVKANNATTGTYDGSGHPIDKGHHGVYAYNGIGWRCIHTYIEPNIPPIVPTNTTGVTWLGSTDVDNNTYLFWGIAGFIFWQKLPKTYANPRELFREGLQYYVSDGYLITSWFDANMEHFQKVVSHFIVNIADIAVGGMSDSSGATVNVGFQYDTGLDVGGWAGSSGGWIDDLSQLWVLDASVNRIRFRIALARGVAVTKPSPVLDSVILKYIKQPTAYSSWSFTVPLNFQGNWGPPDGSGVPRDAMQIKHDLDALITSGTFLTFGHEGNEYRARISGISGADATAQDRRGARTVTVVETPLPAYTPF